MPPILAFEEEEKRPCLICFWEGGMWFAVIPPPPSPDYITKCWKNTWLAAPELPCPLGPRANHCRVQSFLLKASASYRSISLRQRACAGQSLLLSWPNMSISVEFLENKVLMGIFGSSCSLPNGYWLPCVLCVDVVDPGGPPSMLFKSYEINRGGLFVLEAGNEWVKDKTSLRLKSTLLIWWWEYNGFIITAIKSF